VNWKMRERLRGEKNVEIPREMVLVVGRRTGDASTVLPGFLRREVRVAEYDISLAS